MSSKTAGTATGSTNATQTLGPGSHVAELEVKKSRFIGYATHVDSWDDAVQYLESIRKQQHPKARHWCYGYVCGTNERSSDDGEPSGTAGVPILNAIRGAHLDNVMCVVVRYFGGIKLGTGGLIRAYGGTARLVLRDAPVNTLIPQSTVRVSVNAPFIGAIYELIGKVNGTASQEVYGDQGNLTITITCDQTNEIRLRNGLKDVTRGSAIFVDNDL